jgi:hypothetical protein
VNQNVGKFRENLKVKNTVTLKLINVGRKKFIFIKLSRLAKNAVEIQGGSVICCVDLTQND